MDEHKIVGTQDTAFKTKDGQMMEGKTVYTEQSIPPGRGAGYRTDKFFLSAAKLAALDFQPSVGDTVQVLYNRWGRVQTIRLVDVIDIG